MHLRLVSRALVIASALVAIFVSALGCGDDDSPSDVRDAASDAASEAGIPDASMDATAIPDARVDDVADMTVVPPDEGVVDLGVDTGAGIPSCAATRVTRFVGTGNQQGLVAAVDATGTIAIAGRNQGVVDFGDGERDALGAGGLFIVSIADDGTTRWSRFYRAPSDDAEPYGLAFGPDGAIFVTGYVQGEIDLGEGPLVPRIPAAREIVVLALEPDGSTRWSRRYGIGTGWSIAHDGSGHVVVAGDASGAIDFGGEMATAAGQSDAFVLTLDARDGSFVGQRVYGGPRLDAAYGLAVDTSGAVTIVGQTYGDIDFGDGPAGAADASHGFVARHDATGDLAFAIVTDADVETYAVTALADQSVIVQRTDEVVRYDAMGTALWTRPISGSTLARRIEADESGGVWVTAGGRVLDPACGLPTSERTLAITTRLSVEDGSVLEARGVVFDALGEIAAWSVGIGPGFVAAAGWISGGGHDFGTGPIDGDDNDVFVVRYGR